MVNSYLKGEFVRSLSKYRDVIFMDSIKPKNED